CFPALHPIHADHGTDSAKGSASANVEPYHLQVTFAADGRWPPRPSGESAMSNSTACPSCNVPLHDPEIALLWTNTSGEPSAGTRKPIPFWALYHLTVPFFRSASAGVERTASVNNNTVAPIIMNETRFCFIIVGFLLGLTCSRWNLED